MTSLEIYGATQTTTTTTEDASSPTVRKGLQPLPRHMLTFAHRDPPRVFLTGPAEDAAAPEREQALRHRADAHATRRIRGMTYSLRAANIASAANKLQTVVTLPTRWTDKQQRPPPPLFGTVLAQAQA